MFPGKRIFISILILILIVLTGLFLFRNQILQWKLQKTQTRFYEKYGGQIKIGKAEFTGITTVTLDNIVLISSQGDSLAFIRKSEVTISTARLFKLKIDWKNFSMDSAFIYFMDDGTKDNYRFLLHPRKKDEPIEKSTEKDYAKTLYNLTNKIFDMSNNNVTVHDITLTWKTPKYNKKIVVEKLVLNNGNLELNAIDKSNAMLTYWNLQGALSDKNSTVVFTLFNREKRKAFFPFLDDEKGLKCSADTIQFTFVKESYSSSILKFKIDLNISNLTVNHWRLADNDILFKKYGFSIIANAGSNYMEADSSSHFIINDLDIGFYSKVINDSSKKITFNTFFDAPAPLFFTSIPKAIFNTFDGMETSGKLAYQLHFYLNTGEPDSVEFDSELKKSNFKIIHYGKEYYSKINSTFLFDAYDKDRYVRSFTVGPENPDFTPISQISPFLKYAVLTSEDGGFLYHRGFNEEAFRQAIATNYEEKRFVRGGSTITMQLVKNIFLSRDKTISRKLQEALIVWLIENNGLVSKERMLEVYLNIIEWGPNIYGIKEASQFYFKKNPAELNLSESIFLASIIPHPKYFKYSFDNTGTLKPFLQGYYRLMKDRMVHKEWITPNDTINLQPNVTLTGPALNFVLPVDSVPVDSLHIEQDLQILN